MDFLNVSFDVTPARIADWIDARLVAVNFPLAEFNRRAPEVGLELIFSEIVPDMLFHSLRFDLMVEEERLTFEVADALITDGAKPCCRLLLRPVKENGDCHACNFVTLAGEAEKYAGADGRRQDWRHRVTRLRFYHPASRAHARARPNPLHQTTVVVAAADVWNIVPKKMQARDTASTEDYLRQVDEVFGKFIG